MERGGGQASESMALINSNSDAVNKSPRWQHIKLNTFVAVALAAFGTCCYDFEIPLTKFCVSNADMMQHDKNSNIQFKYLFFCFKKKTALRGESTSGRSLCFIQGAVALNLADRKFLRHCPALVPPPTLSLQGSVAKRRARRETETVFLFCFFFLLTSSHLPSPSVAPPPPLSPSPVSSSPAAADPV